MRREAAGRSATHAGDAPANGVDVGRLRDDVARLAVERSRLSAPAGIEAVERLLESHFRRAGWQVERRPFVFENVVGLPDAADLTDQKGDPRLVYERLSGANVVARKDGRDRGSAVVVGAHFDAIVGSPGADDNASGVAALLELARVLAPRQLDRTVVLAAFDMEEIGLFGSRAFVADLAGRTEVVAAIVLEAIAYGSSEPGTQSLPPGIGLLYPAQVREIKRRARAGDWTLVIHRESSRHVAESFSRGLERRAGRGASILVRDPVDLPVLGPVLSRVVPWVNEFARSDHLPFWEAGIPAIQVTDTANFRNPHYHRPTDTPETLDYGRLAAIVGALASTVEELARPVDVDQAPDGARPPGVSPSKPA